MVMDYRGNILPGPPGYSAWISNDQARSAGCPFEALRASVYSARAYPDTESDRIAPYRQRNLIVGYLTCMTTEDGS